MCTDIRQTLKMKHMKLILLLIMAMFFAVNAFCLTLNPNFEQIHFNNNQEIKRFITVKNNSTEKIDITIDAEDWTEGSNPTLRKPAPEWVKVSPLKFSLVPGKEKKIKVIAKMPKYADDHYAIQVFFSYNSKSSSDNTRVGVRVAALLQLRNNRKSKRYFSTEIVTQNKNNTK